MATSGSKNKETGKWIVASMAIGLIAAVLGDVLKTWTERYETSLFDLAERHPAYCFLLPFIGLSAIFFLRLYLFKKRENKGIKEIFNSLRTRHNELPLYKIPSHFINGLLTVAFGGSTGIEVSTVVASASLGAVVQQKAGIHVIFRKELIGAGVAAGVTALFGSPIAGILFAWEVILKKPSRMAFISMFLAAGTAWTMNLLFDPEALFQLSPDHWNTSAFPYFLLLGGLSGLYAVYFTKCVLWFKATFAGISRPAIRISLGALMLSLLLFFFPQLYGDGYHAMRALLEHPGTLLFSLPFVATLACVLFLKPIATSVTLASGGDGGVFAPSLFIGAFLGLLVALLLNEFFGAGVIPLNFMLVGMAAMLSASLHAPFTALFLVCGLAGNFTLFVPLLAGSIAASYCAKAIMPYTVYSYQPRQS